MQLQLLLFLLGSIWTGQCSGHELRIPKLIHRNYMAGAAALQAATTGPQPDFRAHWLASCTTHHPGWQEVIWDEASVLDLMQQDFPWFLPTYLSYPRLVQRSDVMRYMVLYKYGGVYLDADIECYTNMEQSLQDQDLVLSCEDPGAWGQLHNAAMASTPGHPFWLAVLQEAIRRSPATAAANSSWLTRQLRKLWHQTPFHDRIVDVLQSTGPMLLSDVYQSYTGGMPACGHSVVANSMVSTAYPVGTWFTPCLCGDDECARHWMTQHFQLVHLQQQGERVQVVSDWLHRKMQYQERKQRHLVKQHRRRQQEQQHAKSVIVQELLPEQYYVVGIHHYSGSWTGWDQSHRVRQQQQLRQEMSRHVLDNFVQGAAFLQAHGVSPLQAQGSAQARGSATEHTPSSAAGAWADVLQGWGNSSCALLTVLGPSATPAAEAQSPSPAGCSGSSSSSRDGSDNTSTGCLTAYESCSGACAQWVEGGPRSSSDEDSAHVSLLGMPTAEAPAAPAGQLPQAAAQQALGSDHLLEQLGCDVTVVAPSSLPALSSQPANLSDMSVAGAPVPGDGSGHDVISCLEATQQSSLPTTPGSQGNSASPALLHSASSGHTRVVLHFSCSDCGGSVLQQLLTLPWNSSSTLEQVSMLLIDLHQPGTPSSTSSCSSSSCSSQLNSSDSGSAAGSSVLGLDEVFNLLHQQLGFKGFWRTHLSSSTLRLGWVRETVPAHARMQLPSSEHAAAALQAAAAHTARAELVSSVCDCCQHCCRGPGGANSTGVLGAGQPHSCPLWQRSACQMLTSYSSSQNCPVVQAAAPDRGNASIAVGGVLEAPGGCGVSTRGCGSGACAECCACTRSLWEVLQTLAHSSGPDCGSSSVLSIIVISIPVVTAYAMCLASGVLLHSMHSAPVKKKAAPVNYQTGPG